MKLIYKGTYHSEADLPTHTHPAGYVPFREPEDMQQLARMMSRIGLVLTAAVFALLVLRGFPYLRSRGIYAFYGMALSLLTLLPHELLHGICFKGEAELWTNLKMGMLFVVGTEDMSKVRFVFMSLLPNLLFGIVPFALFLAQPHRLLLGALGATCIPMGIGDYYNVYNCLTQVPKGALVYLSGMHSYWYIPEGGTV